MKRTKTIAFTFAGSWLAASAVACVADDGGTDSSQAADLRDFDGSDLFRGVVFGYGPVAELVPEIRDDLAVATENLSAEEKDRIEARYDDLIAAIDELDPAYFAEFEAAVRSGDRQRLVQTIEAGRELMTEATAASRGQGSADEPRLSAAATPDAAAGLWLLLNYPACSYWCPPPPNLFVWVSVTVLPGEANGGLLEERIIDAVVSMAAETEPRET